MSKIPVKMEKKADKKMTLANLHIGSAARVTKINGNGAITRRLMEMGVVPGVAVKVIKSAPFGDPIQISVRGYNLAMRKAEAETIEITDEL